MSPSLALGLATLGETLQAQSLLAPARKSGSSASISLLAKQPVTPAALPSLTPSNATSITNLLTAR